MFLLYYYPGSTGSAAGTTGSLLLCFFTLEIQVVLLALRDTFCCILSPGNTGSAAGTTGHFLPYNSLKVLVVPLALRNSYAAWFTVTLLTMLTPPLSTIRH